MLMLGTHTVHIAGRGSVVRQLRIPASQFRVLRTGTRSEIRPDNMYQPLWRIVKRRKVLDNILSSYNKMFTNLLTLQNDQRNKIL